MDRDFLYSRILLVALTLNLIACSSQAKKQTPQVEDKVQTIQSAKRIMRKLRLKNRRADIHFLRPVKTSRYYSWMNYFTGKNRARFQRFINNGYKHKKLIQGIFKSYDIPEDLFYVGLIESGYYLKAKSHASAVGPWQFIKDTGKRYGLMINRYVDERMHIVKSTNAAARYFKDLYSIFGTWELALTAYNSGEYGLMRRIRKYGVKNYYQLSKRKIIPRETRNYVPKVLAAMEIIENPKEYGFKIPEEKVDIYRYTKKFVTNKAHSIRSLAKKYGLTLSQFKYLNTDLIKHRTPKLHYSKLTIYVPKWGSSKKLSKLIKPRIRKSLLYSRYKVRRGDNLSKIARKHSVSMRTIKRHNKISRGNFLKIGQILKIPNYKKTHTVRRGENLSKIARRYRVSLSKLMRVNDLKSGRIYPGQKLYIAVN
jgi:membrane-bound lytic murein transglycosylase D